MSDDEERCEAADPPPVDDSVPLAFLLGHRYSYYAEAHRPAHTAVVEDRPRTPTDFRDMSKREREVRAKMVLDPLSHSAETFLTGVCELDVGQEFRSTSTRRKLKQERLKQQRKNASLQQEQADLASLDNSHGYSRPKDFLAVDAQPVPTLHDKSHAAKDEAQKVRLKQHWRMQYAQHIHSIAKDQQEFAKHMLAALRYPSMSPFGAQLVKPKFIMEEKRLDIERKKKARDEELRRMKEQRNAALHELRDDIARRNHVAKEKKSKWTSGSHQPPQAASKAPRLALYKLDESTSVSSSSHPLEQTALPLSQRKMGMFRTNRRTTHTMDKYILKSPDRPKPVLGGGFRTEPEKWEDTNDEKGGGKPLISLAKQLPLQLQSLSMSTS
ncbi:hypothetical protein H310_13698 [Aphanomyces invadans]|uniref:Uncharacterized protein n=1 Tax=Aphanomyces invadans TaxID=157072 RepID=A0A024TEB8_9STRA|nr:hypothetical protein H310_13698 [Aphanomyces invadans]ETV91901.1 hypothetical protein H310_13698 [Aphanomyces invadans]|eukprot:XP_008879538.1 hypothetical protein H310_13698 [Aphanomyces invadans]